MSKVDAEMPAAGDGLAVVAEDRHRFSLLLRAPETPRATLLWLPALGVAAKHYLPFAEALAGHGVAVFVHEWRGHGSSSLRAGHGSDWGYRELLEHDLPASACAIHERFAMLPAIVLIGLAAYSPLPRKHAQSGEPPTEAVPAGRATSLISSLRRTVSGAIFVRRRPSDS